jgi:hypothetical protein
MPDLTASRKVGVYRKILALDEPQRSAVAEMYGLIDDIEWLNAAPLIFGIWPAIIIALLGATILKVPFAGHEIIFFVCCIVLYASGFLVIRLALKPRRAKADEQVRTADSNNKDTLDIIRSLDPGIEKRFPQYFN